MEEDTTAQYREDSFPAMLENDAYLRDPTIMGLSPLRPQRIKDRFPIPFRNRPKPKRTYVRQPNPVRPPIHHSQMELPRTPMRYGQPPPSTARARAKTPPRRPIVTTVVSPSPHNLPKPKLKPPPATTSFAVGKPKRTKSKSRAPPPIRRKTSMPADKKGRKLKRATYRVRGHGPSAAEREEANKFMRVFKDPFSSASLTPRIPDGKAITSQGFKFQLRNDFDIPSTGGTIFLQPTINNPCFIYEDKATGDRAVKSFVNNQLLNFEQTVARRWRQPETTAIFKWRVVSYGLHVSLLNNADTNDGWWEAWRMNTPMNPEGWHYWFNAALNQNTPIMAFPPKNRMDIDQSEIVNLPSYTAGRLKDIHGVTFALNPDGCEHDFVEANFDIQLSEQHTKTYAENPPEQLSPEVVNSQTVADGYRVVTETTGATKEFVRTFVDPGWDTLAVKIHARSPAAGSNPIPSKVLVHVVQNIEVIYDDRAVNAKFHTRTPQHSGFTNVSKAIAKKTHAAEVVKK